MDFANPVLTKVLLGGFRVGSGYRPAIGFYARSETLRIVIGKLGAKKKDQARVGYPQ